MIQSEKSGPEEAANANLEGCREPDEWVEYFKAAEPHMDWWWDAVIWPIIRDFDFDVTVELAPGAGRNSAKLLPLVRRLELIDLNQYAIDRCRERFAQHPLEDRVGFHVNDGRSLPMIESGSVSALYSWDSLVHVDRLIVRDYLVEFARVLREGGRAFIHHSNFGARGDGVDFRKNPHWRSNESAERILEDATAAGLVTERQTIIDWGAKRNGRKLDCISVFRKGKPDVVGDRLKRMRNALADYVIRRRIRHNRRRTN